MATGECCCRHFLPGASFRSAVRLSCSAFWLPVLLLVYGSIGNVMGGMFNYGLGRLGKLEWLERYFHVKKTSIDRAYRFMGGHGAWMGFFAFLPILGSAITIVLGLTRANILLSVLSITIGKVLRYAVLIWGADFFF